MKHYAKAQKGITLLKVAIHEYLKVKEGRGATNAEIGRALGIYTGYSSRETETSTKAQEGHIPRTILGYMEDEGVVYKKDKRWHLALF